MPLKKISKIWRILITEFRVPGIVLLCIIIFLGVQFTGLIWLTIIIALSGIVLGSYDLIVESVIALRHKQFALDYIAILAILLSVITQQYIAGLVIALMVATGQNLEAYGMKQARKSLTELVDRIPREVTLFENNQPGNTLQLEQVQVGQTILVRKGEVIALDGILQSEHALTDDSSLTGEPYFLEKNQGDQIRSGIINIGEPMVIEVTRASKDSTYEKIIALVKSAEQEKSPLVRLADRYSTIFTILTLVIASLAFMASHDWLRVLAVLVVATPCPLILATPIALLGGVNALAKYHVIVKKVASLEILARVRTMIFDKTGTITLGLPAVTQVEVTDSTYTAEQALTIAAAIERNSLHPVAKAIVAYAQNQKVAVQVASQVQEKIGSGIQGVVDNVEYSLKKYPTSDGLAIGLEHSGSTMAVFHFSDEIRAGSRGVVKAIQKLGVELMLFTGDKQAAAEKVVQQLDPTMLFRAECTPEDKQAGIAELKRIGKVIAMVGDGINDAPALARADVGIVLSNEQQTAASEAADVVILNSEIELTATLLEVARRTVRIAKQSILWGIGLSVVAMVVAAFGAIPPVTGAILQEGIDLAVIINALRASRQ